MYENRGLAGDDVWYQRDGLSPAIGQGVKAYLYAALGTASIFYSDTDESRAIIRKAVAFAKKHLDDQRQAE
jgi:hypothetical protein